MSRICILADVRYVIGLDKQLQVYKIEVDDGLPGGDWEPVHTEPCERENFHFWRCNNCGTKKETWPDMRQHLGKFHELVDPFNFPEEVADG